MPLRRSSSSTKSTVANGGVKSRAPCSGPRRIGQEFAGSLGEMTVQPLHQPTHIVVVGVRPVRLELGELGRVGRIHVLVAERPTQLVDALETSDQEPFQRELERDPQLKLGVEVPGPGDERRGGRSARHGEKDRGFDLEELGRVEVATHLPEEHRPHAE